mgnify:CR=1 FL=1
MQTTTNLEFMKIFTLWANNQPYDLDGPTFAKMSKKCGKLMSEGKTQGEFAMIQLQLLSQHVNSNHLKLQKVTHLNSKPQRVNGKLLHYPNLSKIILIPKN